MNDYLIVFTAEVEYGFAVGSEGYSIDKLSLSELEKIREQIKNKNKDFKNLTITNVIKMDE